VKLDVVQARLYDLSHRLAQALGSRHARLGDLLVPVSMALLTRYDDEYLGVPEGAPTGSDGEERGA
jgi:hypothetical protein